MTNSQLLCIWMALFTAAMGMGMFVHFGESGRAEREAHDEETISDLFNTPSNAIHINTDPDLDDGSGSNPYREMTCEKIFIDEVPCSTGIIVLEGQTFSIVVKEKPWEDSNDQARPDL